MVNGQDVTKAGKEELRQIRSSMIGMVFQHFALLPHMSVIDNVGLGLRIAGVGRKERRERAGKALELVGSADGTTASRPKLIQQRDKGRSQAVWPGSTSL
ncbi:hypothetical protein NKI24_23060 [Mesorhizobium sp. M0701]